MGYCRFLTEDKEYGDKSREIHLRLSILFSSTIQLHWKGNCSAVPAVKIRLFSCTIAFVFVEHLLSVTHVFRTVGVTAQLFRKCVWKVGYRCNSVLLVAFGCENIGGFPITGKTLNNEMGVWPFTNSPLRFVLTMPSGSLFPHYTSTFKYIFVITSLYVHVFLLYLPEPLNFESVQPHSCCEWTHCIWRPGRSYLWLFFRRMTSSTKAYLLLVRKLRIHECG